MGSSSRRDKNSGKSKRLQTVCRVHFVCDSDLVARGDKGADTQNFCARHTLPQGHTQGQEEFTHTHKDKINSELFIS